MSIVGSISNCRKPIANGSDRNVFYSKRYKCVIKMDKEFTNFASPNEQAQKEEEIFSNMSEDDFEIFPIIDIINYKKKKVVLMKKVKLLPDFCPKIAKKFYIYSFCLDEIDICNEICEIAGIDSSLNEKFVDFVKKYNLKDMHPWNVGVYNNHLCVLDAGY